MGNRTNTAKWVESRQRWQINVQKDGIRKTFTSSKPGRTGQREAHAKADAFLDDGIATNPRVRDLWQLYLDRAKLTTGTANFKKVDAVGRNYILPQIGHLRISAITEGHLQRILDASYKNGSLSPENKQRKRMQPGETLSRKTLSNILCEIKSFIKYCRTIERVTTLMPENLQIPSGARLKGKSILQPQSLTTLFSVDTTLYRGNLIPDPYIHAYRFAVSTGLRPGELVGLWYGDFGKSDTVKIRRSINTDCEATQGKNSGAIRSFILCPQAKKAFEDQVALLRSLGIRLNYNTPLFQLDTQRTYYAYWKRYCASNNIPHISLYEMRHTFVSVVKYLPEGLVKPLVGHSRSMDTFGDYGHELRDDAKATANEVGTLFSKLLRNA